MPADETTTLDVPHARAQRASGEPIALQLASDRRGPFRPRVLAPTRLRLAGGMITRLFQGGDALALGAAGWIAATESAGAVLADATGGTALSSSAYSGVAALMSPAVRKSRVVAMRIFNFRIRPIDPKLDRRRSYHLCP